MSLVLYPRYAPGNSLRVWIGAFQVTQAPDIKWTLNGKLAAPTALREISSVRPDTLLPEGANPAKTPRAFTGVYEFTTGLQPDTFYEITATANGETKTLETRTLPTSVPWGLDRSFNVLLVSCFHQAEDRGGTVGTIVSQLSAVAKPHLTFLAGDQVYLDLPTLKNFPKDARKLAQKFEDDYTLNWVGPLAYTDVLKAAPSVSLPDDHEYWNNFPHPSAIVENSWSKTGQDSWREPARAMFEGFQLAYPGAAGQPVIIDVDPISFFLADTRTDKDPKLERTMSPKALKDLDGWVTDVISKKRFGVFVSGQSLFREPAEAVADALGDYGVGDYELSNYRDFPRIVSSLRRIVDAGRPVLCLTGDVHWGRVATTKNKRTGRIAFAEVISSPASLVSSVGVDQAKQVINVIGGLFGRKNPWPRHSDPGKLPAYLASTVLDKEFPCSLVHGQRGNHIVMLSFRQQGMGVELRLKYWPITRDANIGRPVDVGPIDLISA